MNDRFKPPFTNERWVELLSAPANEQAVGEFRKILIRGLKPALAKYVDRELNQFVEDVAQEALLKILDNVHTFRGESKFVTWAMKIAVREGLSRLRRKRWENISIEDLRGNDGESNSQEIFSDTFADTGPGPEQTAAQKMAVEKIEELIEELLTERQQTAIRALIIQGLPMSVVAEKMDTNRNNLYKLVYDARKKLKNELEVMGINPEEMLDELSNP